MVTVGEEKVLEHYVKGLTILNFEERKRLITSLTKSKPLKQLARDMDIPYTTLHGWKNSRNLYRSEKTIKEISDLNKKLQTIITILESIKVLDNVIAEGLLEKVKKHVVRLKK